MSASTSHVLNEWGPRKHKPFFLSPLPFRSSTAPPSGQSIGLYVGRKNVTRYSPAFRAADFREVSKKNGKGGSNWSRLSHLNSLVSRFQIIASYVLSRCSDPSPPAILPVKHDW